MSNQSNVNRALVQVVPASANFEILTWTWSNAAEEPGALWREPVVAWAVYRDAEFSQPFLHLDPLTPNGDRELRRLAGVPGALVEGLRYPDGRISASSLGTFAGESEFIVAAEHELAVRHRRTVSR